MRHDNRTVPKTSLTIPAHTTGKPLLLGVILLVVSSIYIYGVFHTVSGLHAMYDETSARITANSIPLTQAVRVSQEAPPITVMLKDPFRESGRWLYVSSVHPLPADYRATSLVASGVPEGGTDTMKIAARIKPSLAALFNAAEKDGVRLVLSSAYRSNAQQTAVYNQYVQTQGVAAAKRFVANPGESEHATGLAVDINTYSDACDIDEAACAISSQTADWLKLHAGDYGFILRYPPGKEEKTGVANEPWHFRYVGDGAASLMVSGLTLDEFVEKVEPSLLR